MSRYRRVITGEKELPEISGTKFVIYPTIATRMKMLDHVKSGEIFEEIDIKDANGKVVGKKRIMGKHFDIAGIANLCAEMVYEGCFEHDADGVRTKKKEGEEDTSYEHILALVVESSIMSLYLEILLALDIVSKDKADEIKSRQKKVESDAEEKKEE